MTAGETGNKANKEYIMNPQGKSSVCILHEYVQHALRKQPTYVFRELENAATPYSATVVINNMQYGTGYGSSKKQAKAEAAKVTLEILIPQMKEQLDGSKKNSNNDFDICEVSNSLSWLKSIIRQAKFHLYFSWFVFANSALKNSLFFYFLVLQTSWIDRQSDNEDVFKCEWTFSVFLTSELFAKVGLGLHSVWFY